MARAIWTGSISFGLVSIPVGLFSATEDHTVHFHQFERGTSDRVRNQRVNERTGKEVDYEDIVKGVDVGDGETVIVEPDELAAVAPGRSRNLDISDFVALDEIDPIYFQKTYWLAPTGEEYARPYALLLRAMRETNRAAIGTFVMRGKEYLAAIRPDRDVLALETLFFADEVRDPADELENLPGGASPKGKELEMATNLIDSMSSPWRPERYRDSYRERVEKLIEDKHRGREVVVEAEPPDATEMADLMAALQRSVDEARKRGSKDSPARSGKASSKKSGGGSKGSGRGGTTGGRGKKAGSRPTKAELLDRARELDVPGRSRMSRDELAAAVDGATGRRRAS